MGIQNPISGTASGPAGGDLSGTYPNPSVVATHLSASLPVAQGGTGETAAGAAAANNIGALAIASNFSDLANVATARANLGLGTAATQSTAAFLQATNNLSDVANVTTARSNLGLGTAATQNTTSFLQVANNLSDVASVTTARANLGLGTAATQSTAAFLQATNNLSDVANTATARGNLAAAGTGVANTFTADQTLQSSDAGAAEGPLLILDRNSASPAANDLIGAIPFRGRDGAANTETYAKLLAQILDPTSASEDAILALQTIIAGTLATRATIGAGLYMAGATGGDQGSGTINATALYQNGVAVGTGYVLTTGNQNLTGGFTYTSYSNGTVSSGTLTPSALNGNFQHYTNSGAHTLAPPTAPCSLVLECTNSSAGAITTSGFNVVAGDTYSPTGTRKYNFLITKTVNTSSLYIQYVTGT